MPIGGGAPRVTPSTPSAGADSEAPFLDDDGTATEADGLMVLIDVKAFSVRLSLGRAADARSWGDAVRMHGSMGWQGL